MKSATKRSILRWIHIVVTIPIFGYIYGPAAEVEQYAGATRYVFVPVMVLSGLWMYAGIYVAIIGVALLLGAYQLSGFGAAVLTQVGLLLVHRIWLAIRARRGQRLMKPNCNFHRRHLNSHEKSRATIRVRCDNRDSVSRCVAVFRPNSWISQPCLSRSDSFETGSPDGDELCRSK